MKWERVGEYGMKAKGMEYRVGKFFEDGATLYLVTYGEDTRLKWCADWEQAQKVAQAHSEGKPYENV
jgi:hypothetical protein